MPWKGKLYSQKTPSTYSGASDIYGEGFVLKNYSIRESKVFIFRNLPDPRLYKIAKLYGQGIYILINKRNRKAYVGSTINLYNRLINHFSPSEGAIQRSAISPAIKKYSLLYFKVIIIAIPGASGEELIYLEQHFLDTSPMRYNIQRNAAHTHSVGYVVSEDTRQKQSQATGRPVHVYKNNLLLYSFPSIRSFIKLSYSSSKLVNRIIESKNKFREQYELKSKLINPNDTPSLSKEEYEQLMLPYKRTDYPTQRSSPKKSISRVGAALPAHEGNSEPTDTVDLNNIDSKWEIFEEFHEHRDSGESLLVDGLSPEGRGGE
jgi:hypothetical protein